MTRFLPLLALFACDPGTSVGTNEPDLSGYATLDDLEALQVQIDEQAAEIEGLRAQVPIIEGGDCDASGSTHVEFAELVEALVVRTCRLDNEGLESEATGCGSTAFTVWTSTDPQGAGYTTRVDFGCAVESYTTYEIVYLSAE